MWRLPDLSRRIIEAEQMDDPGLDPVEHRRALAGLARLNRIGDSAGVIWRGIRRLASTPGHTELSVLDIATGSGDVPVAVARRARRAGLHLSFSACDVSETALRAASQRAEQCGVSLTTFPLDAVSHQLPGEYDVVMCSLFTHHLEEDQVVDLLYKMKAAARRVVLVNDLVRDRQSYIIAVATARVVSRSRVVHGDSAKSMRAAFTISEFEALADRAGLAGATVKPEWPCRFVLSWSRD